MALANAWRHDRAGRGLAVGAALAALAAGGLTMTDRALGAAPAPPDVCVAGAAQGVDSPGAAIPDNSPAGLSRTILVSGAPASLLDIDVRTTIAHSFSGDLEIELTSPQGTTVLLKGATRNFVDPDGPGIVGGKANVYSDTLWDDSASVPATDKLFQDGVASGPMIPEEALGAFIGENPNGEWTLTVRDTDPGAVGSLTSWSLSLSALQAAPPLTATQTTGTAPLNIPDGGGVVSRDISVSGAKGYLYDVDVETLVTHPDREDLHITLTHLPSGRSTVLSTDNRGLPTTATFDDSAGVGVGSFADPVPSARVAPEGAMAAFAGIDPNGTWRISVRDDFDDTPDSGGVLNTARLLIQSTDGCVPPPAPPAPPAPAPVAASTPLVLPPATPPPPALVAKLKPRALRVSVGAKRVRTAPYRFRVAGRIVLPARANVCAGRVQVVLRAGKRVVGRRTVRVRRSGKVCVYRVAVTIKRRPASLPRSGALRVNARFLGTSRLKPRGSRTVTVRLGR